jgi:RNA polymerase sigma-70 factor (ECF subfamily)
VSSGAIIAAPRKEPSNDGKRSTGTTVEDKDARGVTFLSRDAAVNTASPAVDAVDQRLTRLLDDYASALRRAVARVCPRDIPRDEIEQEARIRLWHALQREKDITDPASYLYRIAATATIDAIRRIRARRETPLSVVEDLEERTTGPRIGASAPSPEQITAAKELGDRIRHALATLADKRRRVVALHLQGFSLDEIGALLEWSEPKVRNLLYRGLSDLRQQLESEGIDRA